VLACTKPWCNDYLMQIVYRPCLGRHGFAYGSRSLFGAAPLLLYLPATTIFELVLNLKITKALGFACAYEGPAVAWVFSAHAN
jgi:hypothetical protein